MTFEERNLAAIMTTIELYVDGHYYLNRKKLEQAFHPQSVVIGYYEEALKFYGRDEYISDLSSATSSAELGELLQTEIVSLDYSETTASVKLKNCISGEQFVSRLAIVKVGDDWKIVNGLFDTL